MDFKAAFRMALGILTHAKLRSWLTILGIVIGVAAVVLIVSIGDGARTSIQERLSSFDSNAMTIYPTSDRAGGPSSGFAAGFLLENSARSTAKNLTQRDLASLSTVAGVKTVAGEVSGRANVELRGESASVSLTGVEPLKWRDFSTPSLAQGRWLQVGDTNSVLVGSRVANEVYRNKITLNSRLSANGVLLQVVGILNASEGFSNAEDNSIILPLKTARAILNLAPNYFSTISLAPAQGANVRQVEASVESTLLNSRGERNETKTFSVVSFQTARERVGQALAGMTLFLGAIAGIALLIGAIGIANTMFTSVLEKTKDIGVMKAVGATDNDVLKVFLINAGLIGLVGGLIGCAIGILVSLAFSSLNIAFGPPGTPPLRAIITPFLIVGMLLFSIFVGVASGLFPAYRASQLRPAEALKYE